VQLTEYQTKYYAYELTKRCPADSIEKLAGALVDAQVDLNAHQVEAALFAFKSPFSKGAILADEVGLGKTIEAGLVLSQKWAECETAFKNGECWGNQGMKQRIGKGVSRIRTVRHHISINQRNAEHNLWN
jgi:hypothetical protein